MTMLDTGESQRKQELLTALVSLSEESCGLTHNGNSGPLLWASHFTDLFHVLQDSVKQYT